MQAVRLEVLLESAGEHTPKSFASLATGINKLSFRRGLDGPWQIINRPFIRYGDESLVISCGVTIYRKPPIRLPSIGAPQTFAIAARPMENESGGFFPIRRPLFILPGQYTIRLHYTPSGSDSDEITGSCVIPIADPRGMDSDVYDRLVVHDNDLSSALLHPTRYPSETFVVAATQLIAERPHSSYADYARLLLARAHLGGSGWDAMYTRKESKILKEEFIRRSLWWLSSPGESAAVHRRIAAALPCQLVYPEDNDLLAAIVRRRHEPETCREKLSALTNSPTIFWERATAKRVNELLDGIRDPNFPYAPQVLYMKAAAHARFDPVGAREYLSEIKIKWPDSSEWEQIRFSPWPDHPVGLGE